MSCTKIFVPLICSNAPDPDPGFWGPKLEKFYIKKVDLKLRWFSSWVSIKTSKLQREYWMINRGPCFLAVVWFGSSPSPVIKLSLYHSLPVCRRSGLLTGEGRGRSQIIRRRESWSSVNHSILSASSPPERALWGLSNMNELCLNGIIAMGLVYPLSEHVDIFPVRLVSTFHRVFSVYLILTIYLT